MSLVSYSVCPDDADPDLVGCGPNEGDTAPNAGDRVGWNPGDPDIETALSVGLVPV